jgi:hypothetical protein
MINLKLIIDDIVDSNPLAEYEPDPDPLMQALIPRQVYYLQSRATS